ncbi:MAG: cupredoxin domain-containing protein [Nitrospiraceae bacterium]
MISPARSGRERCHLGWMLYGCLILAATTTGATPPVATLAPADASTEERVVVKIRARQFEPAHVRLHAGRKTTLVFQNEDAELHAFAPGNFFVGVNLNISGNGAPEFGDHGFKRVIIPSEGLVEIRFVPDRIGVYPFSCDMPGHEMKAALVVEE